MAGTGVGKFSSTAGSNTANMSVNFAENMAPSAVNNAARELMGHMRDMYEQLGDGYFEFGDGDGTYTVARGDADTITLTSSADISGIYFAGRKIRITDGGANVVEGTIASSSHSSTTQTVNLTGISLASGTPTKVELGIDTAAFGGRIILDDDGDTYIEAVTDDTIDIYVGGAKDFQFVANNFKVLSGSNIAFATDSIAYFGDGNNLQIKSDGTNSFITESGGSGNLRIQGQTIRLEKSDGEIMLEATNDAGVDIRHNNIKKLETTATGIDITGAFTATAASTITVADNSNALTLISTDADAASGPTIRLFRDSATAADGDNLGFIKFDGKEESDGGEVGYLAIQGKLVDSADGAVDGALNVELSVNSSGKSAMLLGPTETVFNEDSADIDFRVESNSNTHAFFIDAGLNCIMIEQNASAGTRALPNAEAPILQIKGNTASSSAMLVSKHAADASPPALYFYKSRNTSPGAFTIINDGDTVGSISMFADDGTDANSSVVAIEGQIDGTPGANDTPGRLLFYTTADGANGVTERLRIANNGDLTATDTSIGSNSDSRLKENVANYTYDITKFKQFQAKTFDWKNPEEHNGKTGNRGFIAQEIAAIDDYWTDQISIDSNKEDAKLITPDSNGNHNAYTLKLGKKDAMYVSVIQQLIARIEALEA